MAYSILFSKLIEHKPVPRLKGSKCSSCNLYYFPQRSVCPRCFLEGLDECYLDNCGEVKVFTIVHAKPPKGFKSPYMVGYVELKKEGLAIPSIITSDDFNKVKTGMTARLIVEPLSDNEEGNCTLVYKFEVRE